jgi:hypothetical protein
LTVESLRRDDETTSTRTDEKMSSRAVRKAMRRMEAQKEKQNDVPIVVPEPEEEEEEAEEASASAPSNPFAMVCKWR